MRRAAIACVLAALIGSAPVGGASAAGPPKEACPPITTLRFADPVLGSAVEYNEQKKLLTFTTEDGRKLEGPNARRFGKRRISVTSRTKGLSIVLQADLVRGQARVTVVERNEAAGPAPRFHRLFVGHGGTKLGPCRAAWPDRQSR